MSLNDKIKVGVCVTKNLVNSLYQGVKKYPGVVILEGLLGMVAISSMLNRSNTIKEQKLYDKLYQETLIKADINKDGVTTHDEWERVYIQLGMTDANNPPILTTDNLMKYLSK